MSQKKKQTTLLGFFSPKVANTPSNTPLVTPTQSSKKKQDSLGSLLSSNLTKNTNFSSDVVSSPVKRSSTTTPFEKKKKTKEEWAWLEHPRDSEKRDTLHPLYDKSTLYIPPSDFVKLTAMEKQYWDIKRTMFDTIIFFQKGKFYELYSLDADKANNLFGMTLANRSSMMRMAGVPTFSFDQWAHKFTSQGFKIARVDQKEDIGKMKNREVAQVYTKSTLFELETDPFGSLLLSLFQIESTIGLTIIDVQSGCVYVSSFEFKDYPQILGTILARQDVKEVLLLKDNTNPKLLKFIKGSDPRIDVNYRNASEFESFDGFMQFVCKYNLNSTNLGSFCNSVHNTLYKTYNSDLLLPTDPVLLEESSIIAILPSLTCSLHYLVFCHLFSKIKEALSIELFDPSFVNQFSLDGTTIQHLELFGSTKQEQRYSLFQFLDHTVTPMGKRLLKSWLIHPLLSIPDIKDRQIACQDVEHNPQLLQLLNQSFDIPRVLMKCKASLEHPKHFIQFLSYLKDLQLHSNLELKSNLLIGYQNTLKSMSTVVDEMSTLFNFELAKDENIMLPKEGFNEELDKLHSEIDLIDSRMEEYLHKLPFSAEFTKSNQDYFLIQINAKSSFLSDFTEYSKTAKVKRLTSSITRSNSEAYKSCIARKQTLLIKIQSQIYDLFLQHKSDILHWNDFLSILDCLNSFNTAKNIMGIKCLPEFRTGAPFLELKENVHPVMQQVQEFIPNDIKIRENALILTGPNMGGKSTLGRSLCIAVLLAQIGMYVPCSVYNGTIVDQLFTRVGARDDMTTGQSTFMVELMETSRILRLATPHSLVIMDEFGRGTSSVDGYALATSVLKFLKNLKCRVFFATHFQIKIPDLLYQYMNYQLNTIDNEQPSIVFLYKLVDGVCPKSCGFEVAKLAGIPAKLIERAQEVSKQYIDVTRTVEE